MLIIFSQSYNYQHAIAFNMLIDPCVINCINMYCYPLTYTIDPPHVLFTDLCCYSCWLHELVPVGMCYLFQPSIQLSCVIHCIVIHELATLCLTCHPQGHSFNMHCITLAPCYQPLMCIFNHHGVLVTIDMLYWQSLCVSSTMTSVFYLSVTT